MIGIRPPFNSTDYMVNTQSNYLETHQLICQQSAEDADLFIDLFKQAIDQGYSPNDPAVQEEVFKHGQLGGMNGLVIFDRERLTREVENYFNKK